MKINKDSTMAKATAKDYIKHYLKLPLFLIMICFDTIGNIFEYLGDDDDV